MVDVYGDDLPQRQPVPQHEQHMQQGDRIRAARQGDGHPAAGDSISACSMAATAFASTSMRFIPRFDAARVT